MNRSCRRVLESGGGASLQPHSRWHHGHPTRYRQQRDLLPIMDATSSAATTPLLSPVKSAAAVVASGTCSGAVGVGDGRLRASAPPPLRVEFVALKTMGDGTDECVTTTANNDSSAGHPHAFGSAGNGGDREKTNTCGGGGGGLKPNSGGGCGPRLHQPRMSLLGKPINYKNNRRDVRYRRLQSKIYNFLERPRGCRAVTYHILV